MLPKNLNNYITVLSAKYNLPPQVISVICNHPFMFASRRISEGDIKPIMFAYLGKLKMKKSYAKKSSEDKEDARKGTTD